MIGLKAGKNVFGSLATMAAIVLAGCGQSHPAAQGNSTTSNAVVEQPDSPLPAEEHQPADAGPDSPSDSSAPSDPATESVEPVAPPQSITQESDAPTSPKAAQRPPADRTPTRPGEAEKVTFEDLNLGMQADVVFRPFMLTDRVKELEGKKVSIVGYMHGGQSSQRGIDEFILLKNTQCKFGPGGQADHLANVILRAGQTTQFSPSPLKVEGTLKIESFQGPDGNTWSIYRLEGAQIR